jgi:hypothetical protein
MTTAAERKYEELARRMTELKEQMLALATEVHQDRAPGKKDDDARDHIDSVLTHVDVRKAVVMVKFDCERQLDLLAKHLQGPGQTYERAYSDMLETPLGKSMLATLDEATALASGNPTAGQIEEHRKSLA